MQTSQTQAFDGSEIAIVGMACQFPKANGPAQFWKNLRNGVDCISFLTDEELEPSGVDPASLNDPNYVKAASVLDGVELFDAAFFGIPASDARLMDPQHRLLLQCAWEALEDAGHNPDTYQGAIGVFAGARTSSYLFNLYSNPELASSVGAFEIGLGNDLAFLSSRISYKLNLRGPSYSIQTACSTSLVAVHLACQSLLVGECQMALAGGVAVNVPHKTGYLYRRGGILSPDGHCRAFDEKAQGTIFGSGAGMLVLKRLEDAVVDRDHIYALIRGSATNNDGCGKASFTAPSIQGQASVVLDALTTANVNPEAVSYIEAHGTGTAIGDPIEIKALTNAYRTRTTKRGFCGLGSVKSNLGHLDAAAGMASIIKLVLSFRHNLLVPTLHFQSRNPHIELADSPFYIVDRLTEWKSDSTPRIAGVSAFGVGGTNAHIILQEAPAAERPSSSRPRQLLVISAKTSAALDVATTNLTTYLQANQDLCLADASYTLATGRTSFKHRRFVLCRDNIADAIQQLENSRGNDAGQDITEAIDYPVVFMFPGQGSQYLGMGRELYEKEPVFRQEITRCSEIVRREAGFNLLDLFYNAEGQDNESVERDLNQTLLTQCALFAVEYALAQLWLTWGIRPEAMIGHSLGEYVAACLADVFSLEEALILVIARGRLMQESPSGAMLAVALTEKEASLLVNGNLSLAAVNGSSQCVLSGSVESISEVQKKIGLQGVPCHRLPSSRAFHSSLMESVAARFGEHAARVHFKVPKIRYVSNLTGTWIRDEEATNPDYWVQHLRQTVRFHQGVNAILAEGRPVLLEIGPGQTLSKLARCLDPTNKTLILSSLYRGESEQASLSQSLGCLWLAGAKVNWHGYFQNENRNRVSLPTYPFEGERYWLKVHPAGNTGSVSLHNYNLHKQADLTDWFYVPSWELAVRTETGTVSSPGCWIVFADGLEFSSEVVVQLEALGHNVIQVRPGTRFSRESSRHYVIRTDQSESYDLLFDSIRNDGYFPQHVMHCFSLTESKLTCSAPAFRTMSESGYYSLLYLSQSITKLFKDQACDLTVVSNDLVHIPGEDRGIPEKAGLIAACLLIPQETPNLTFRCLDIGCAESLSSKRSLMAEQVISEGIHASAQGLVALRGSKRWIQVYEPIKIKPRSQQLRKLRLGGVYLITGGLGSVGLLIAEHLTRTLRPRLILTARETPPPRAEWQQYLEVSGPQDPVSQKISAVLKLEQLGAEVMLSNADASSDIGMKELVDEVFNRYGALNGVVHAAGITSGPSLYRPYAEIGEAESEAQFRPKVYGTYALRHALQNRDFDFCILFSSNAAVLGGLGYLTYAAANSFMDSFAAALAKNDDRWISASWDPWPRETKKVAYQTSIDQYSMTQEQSVEAFERIVTRCPSGRVIVATGDLRERLKIWTNKAMDAVSSSTQARPKLKSNYVGPSSESECRIAQIWESVLGIADIGVHDNFFDLGGHSLLAIKLMNLISEDFKASLPISKFFENPTIFDLSNLIASFKKEPHHQVLGLLAHLPASSPVSRELECHAE